MKHTLGPIRGRAPRTCAFATTLALVILAAATAAAPARAGDSPVSGSVGYDYYSGPESQTTWRPIGEITADLRAVAASLSVSHFDDSQSGNAWGYTGGLAFPVAPRAKLDLAGTGFAGDSTHGAWRLKLGPQFEIAKERTLGLYWERYDDRLGATANALNGEFDTRLVDHLSGTASLSLERSGNTAGADASVGLGWAPTDLLEFEVNGDVSRNGSGLTGMIPSRRVMRSRQSRDGNAAARTSSAVATADISESVTLGLRVHF